MNTVVSDADALIALVHEGDTNHNKAVTISSKLLEKGVDIFFPNTAILEAITALKRALNKPNLAHLINKKYQQGEFSVIYIDEEIQLMASRLFDQKANSKQNTIFDAIVVAAAKKYSADAIFSFDSWYPKLGMTLVKELVDTN